MSVVSPTLLAGRSRCGTVWSAGPRPPRPYSRELTRAISAAATYHPVNHPLLSESTTDSNRAAVLVVTSDRGLAGAYSANVLRTAERMIARITNEGREVALYVSGRKALTYSTFRNRPVAGSWVGHSDRPTYDVAREIGDALIRQFLTENTGVDDVHLVYTRFHSMLNHELVTVRMLPDRGRRGRPGAGPRRSSCRLCTSSSRAWPRCSPS